MKVVAMLFVRDVEASSRWYQSALGLHSAHGGPHFEMLADDDKNLLLQLHLLDMREHGEHRLTGDETRGAGVLLYLETTDVRALHARALRAGAAVQNEPTFQKQAGHTEFVLHDPDGYAIAPFTRGEV